MDTLFLISFADSNTVELDSNGFRLEFDDFNDALTTATEIHEQSRYERTVLIQVETDVPIDAPTVAVIYDAQVFICSEHLTKKCYPENAIFPVFTIDEVQA